MNKQINLYVMPCLVMEQGNPSSRKRRRALKLDDTIRPKWALIKFKDLPQEPAEILPVDRFVRKIISYCNISIMTASIDGIQFQY